MGNSRTNIKLKILDLSGERTNCKVRFIIARTGDGISEGPAKDDDNAGVIV